jgi:AraC-like DNA-binding protein
MARDRRPVYALPMPRESAVLTHVHVIEPFSLLRATYVTQRFAPHTHEEYAIGVVEGGATRSWCRGHDDVHGPGTIITINPGEVHAGDAAGKAGWSYRMLYPTATLMATLAAEAGLGRGEAPELAAPSLRDPALAARLRAMHATLESSPDTLARESALVETLVMLLKRHALAVARRADPRGTATAIARVRDFLEAEYARPVALRELSALVRLSPFHLIRAFRGVVGVPPYRYLELVRIRRARAMIAQGQDISSVAFATGFSDQSHFTRHFKRVVGVPPGQYARSLALPGRPVVGPVRSTPAA